MASTASGSLDTRHSPIPTARTFTFASPQIHRAQLRSTFPVHRRADRLQRMPDPRQALGMSHHEITAGLQARGEVVNHTFLGLTAEIDHYVATENRGASGKARRRRQRDQVHAPECHHRRYFRLNSIPAFPATFSDEQMLAEPGGER